MSDTTILVLICLIGGLICAILTFVGYKLENNKLSYGILGLTIFFLILLNIILYKGISNPDMEEKKEIKDVKTKSLDGIKKIREEKNKAIKGN